MKEHTRKKVNVFGVDVSVMRPDKAVNITLNYINRKELNKIYFHTAASSLFCQTREWAAQWIDSCDLVFSGDRALEEHTSSKDSVGNPEKSSHDLFADLYIKRLFYRMNKESREIFVIMSTEEHLTALKEYMHESYPEILVEGAVITEGSSAESEKVVNEINGLIPDVVFVCLDSEKQLTLLHEYEAMMNTHLIVGIETIQPMIQTEMEIIPGWVETFHLTAFYKWIKKEGKIQEQIVHSLFRRTVLKEEDSNTEEDKKIIENHDEGEE
ncbi:MAG: WecB/TagA/CpsF family glycosyltransferase [Eubacteriales bacterium]|nr:WecB/TagA/CpsF family glycosyltransferase [Eubacteriales bacterium]